MKIFKVGLVLLTITQPISAGEPDWATKPISKVGNLVAVPCHGVGPDKDTAQRSAISQCTSKAADFIVGAFDIKTMSIETEQSAGMHSEVSSKYDVKGLSCKPERQHYELIEEVNNAWVECKFNSSLANIVPLLNPKNAGKNLSSSNSQLIVTSIPKCNSMVIRGTMDRIVNCKENPQTVLIHSSDRELIVRSKGYLPKHIAIESDFFTDSSVQTMEVSLEKY